MVEENKLAQGSGALTTVLPPTQGVAHFAVATNVNEVLLSLGQSRVAIHVDNGTPTPRIEWLLTLSLSPTATLILLKQLKIAVDVYEKTFGKIPEDPKLKISTDPF